MGSDVTTNIKGSWDLQGFNQSYNNFLSATDISSLFETRQRNEM